MKKKPPVEYHIATVADFAKVPDDRLHDCLQEFCGLLINHRINLQRPDFDLRLESWTWVDDGIHMVREVHLTAGDQTETIPNPHFPKPKR